MADVFMALAHHPVYNKNREVIASALTTIDMHDLARLAATYALKGLYVVTPLEDQRRLAGNMLDHWCRGWGSEYNKNRAEALALVRLSDDLEQTRDDISTRCGRPPLVVGTSAASGPKRTSFVEARKYLQGRQPVLVVFGTAWGLTDEALATFDISLEPVIGPTKYNHLSVRSAAGIVMDRLLGQGWDNLEERDEYSDRA